MSYKFDGWYDDVVGGTKITTRYNFKDDTTIYAHWTPTAKKNTATAAKTTTTAPAAADTEKSWKLKDNLGTVLVVTTVVAVVVTVVAAQGS